KLVEHDGDVPGERPEGGQREGIPGGPQARGDWHDGGVAMPDMVRPAGNDRLGVYFDRPCALLRKGRVRLSKPRPVQHSSDSRGTQVQAGASEQLGNASPSHRGQEPGKVMGDPGDEIRK